MCDYGNKRSPVEHVILFFFFGEGSFLKCEFEMFRKCGHTRPMRMCGVRARTECVHCERFSLLSSVPFLKGIGKQPISCARQRLTRVNCWSRMIMCCHLHRLIQQKVLFWYQISVSVMRLPLIRELLMPKLPLSRAPLRQ